jgi:nucleoside-diphosphate-sugar epimerase
VWVDDAADALARLAEHGGFDLAGRVFHLAARTDIGARDVVEHFAETSGRALRFHGRPVALSWALGRASDGMRRLAGRRGDGLPLGVLSGQALRASFTCDNARLLLGWRPLEDRAGFLERAVTPMVDGPGAGELDAAQ